MPFIDPYAICYRLQPKGYVICRSQSGTPFFICSSEGAPLSHHSTLVVLAISQSVSSASPPAKLASSTGKTCTTCTTRTRRNSYFTILTIYYIYYQYIYQLPFTRTWQCIVLVVPVLLILVVPVLSIATRIYVYTGTDLECPTTDCTCAVVVYGVPQQENAAEVLLI